ncbi:hypothetical protein ABIB51_004254 [Arthrobacter sp. UYCu712]
MDFSGYLQGHIEVAAFDVIDVGLHLTARAERRKP